MVIYAYHNVTGNLMIGYRISLYQKEYITMRPLRLLFTLGTREFGYMAIHSILYMTLTFTLVYSDNVKPGKVIPESNVMCGKEHLQCSTLKSRYGRPDSASVE